MSGWLIRVDTPGLADVWVSNGTWLSVRSSAGVIDDLDEAEWTAASLKKICPTATIHIIPEEEA